MNHGRQIRNQKSAALGVKLQASLLRVLEACNVKSDQWYDN
jgi:hypothetical protein